MKRKRTKTIPEEMCELYSLENPELTKLSVQELKSVFLSTGMAYADGYDQESFTSLLSGAAFVSADWKEHKQIYRFTDNLFNDISEMEDARIPADALNLPFPCIYIDLKGQLDNMLGCMIDYQERKIERNGPEKKFLILCMFLKSDKKDGSDWDMLFAQDVARGSINAVVRRIAKQCPRVPYENIMTIIRLALYLSSSKPDVENRNKQTPAVRRSPKALAEEIGEWDVGIRYTKETKEIRIHSDEAETEKISESVRKRPRAHIRKAHWHLYWTGKDRKIPVVHFLPPTFVNTGNNSETPIVIRTKE